MFTPSEQAEVLMLHLRLKQAHTPGKQNLINGSLT
jgi:hypothetical protein